MVSKLKTEKKKSTLDQSEICFLFQLKKLRKIHEQNWENKMVKTSDEFVVYYVY